MKNAAKQNPITPEIDKKMRLIANLIIDRIFEDQTNNTLRFEPNQDKQKEDDKKRVNQNRNTT